MTNTLAPATAQRAGDSGGFVIVPVFESTITDDPTLAPQIETSIFAAIDFYESHIVTNETLTIDFSFLNIAGLGRSDFNLDLTNYTAIRNSLTTHANAIGLTSIDTTLPASDPISGSHSWYMSVAERGALNAPASGANDIGTAGSVTLDSEADLAYGTTNQAVPGEFDAVGVLEHEISEVMGRIQSEGVAGAAFGTAGAYMPYDLFRFAAPGAPLYDQGTAYTSINNGTTSLGSLNALAQDGDLGDWSSAVADDLYDNQSEPGVANVVSANDLTVMSALGYTLACFAEGTCIATPSGEVAVERLGRNDPVVVAGRDDVAVRRVAWIGHRRVSLRRHPRPQDVLPVRVAAGAFGPGRPVRDLRLSPDHAVFVDGALVPIRYLANGRTIRQEVTDHVTYFHVELDRHDVLLAEGLPCESYLDTGNRGAFENGPEAQDLHPDFAARSLDIWRRDACAPLLRDGPALAAIRSRLLARADILGHGLTADPALAAFADGLPISIAVDGRRHVIRLPPAATAVRLASRVWVPAHTRADETDTRALGVALADISLDGRPIALDDHRLSSGWHAPEAAWRWTDGDAGLALAGIRTLAFTLAMVGTYWESSGDARVRVDGYGRVGRASLLLRILLADARIGGLHCNGGC